MPAGRGCWFQAACWEEDGEEEDTWALDWEEEMRSQALLIGLS